LPGGAYLAAFYAGPLTLDSGESDQAFRLCPQMKYAIGRTLAELASALAAVDTWLGVEHINRLGGQALRGLEDFIEVPFQEAAVRPVGPAFG
jgi:hypothetical protein